MGIHLEDFLEIISLVVLLQMDLVLSIKFSELEMINLDLDILRARRG